MATRKCPVCGASVKLENLERHVVDVHPGQEVSLALSEDEKTRLRAKRRPGAARLPVKRSTVAIGVTLALIVAGLAVAWPYLPKSGPMHIHPRLAITINGQTTAVPASIGIDPSLWNDHSLDRYGGVHYPLHTHDTSGTIHVESTVTRDYTLGEFFRVWGQSFDAGQVLGHPADPGHTVWMVVNARRMAPSGSLVLMDQMSIEIVCGPA